MKMWPMLVCAGLLASFTAIAEELEVFNARSVPIDAWTWSDAKIVGRAERLIVTEANKTADYGNVFVESYLPYYPEGKILLKVDRILAGDYTLQVLAYAGDTHIKTVDAVAHATNVATREITMASLDLPPETRAVILKVWVGGAEGATTVLDQLIYSIPLNPAAVRIDDRFNHPETWILSDVVLTPGEEGAELKLADGKSFGSILYSPRLERNDAEHLLVHVPELVSGTITMQVVAFDAGGAYLDSLDVLANFTGGWRGLPMSQVAWPEGAATFQIKLWLAGGSGTSAQLARMLLIGD